MNTLPEPVLNELALAKNRLENPGFTARLAHAVGKPIESLFSRLPGVMHKTLQAGTRSAVTKAVEIAVRSLGTNTMASKETWHKAAVGLTGGVGGAFGVAGLAVELPISTTLILRSIADIARANGESLDQAEVRLECVRVLALGSPAPGDDSVDAGYFASRAALAQMVAASAQHVTAHGVSSTGSPVLLKLITEIASRFSIVVGEKAMAQAVPMVGALGGAAINTLFMTHFQEMAKGHFTIRRLERTYGETRIREAYQALP
ncbi:MAG: EcsC family protein [Pigmentiphaga sp.]|nr:EcsC family protein [Pigmentiphaga sp.]